MIKLKADFSTAKMGATRMRDIAVIFKLLKENDCGPRVLCPVQLSFNNVGKTKIFSNKNWDVTTNRSSLKEIFKDLFHAESKWSQIGHLKNKQKMVNKEIGEYIGKY